LYIDFLQINKLFTFANMDTMRKIAFLTLGCKLNYSETSTISKQFPENEFVKVDFKEKADIYIINSCCVTDNAEKKCNQYIRQAKKHNPNAIIAVVGCYAQLKPEIIAIIEGVDIVLGNENKFNITELLHNFQKNTNPLIANIDINKTSTFKPSYSSGDRTRSFLKVQDGCDYFCSYCTVPYVRGRSRSANIEDVLQSINEIAAQGIKEVVLTGINIGDFGKHEEHQFIDLLNEIENHSAIERIRISSIEPDLLSIAITDLVCKSKKMMPHFHIPLQSGNDKTLKAMQRRYTTRLFSERIQFIKDQIPLCCIASDIIVGFPGETNDDFDETYRFIENSSLSYMHVFTYSERNNTPASKLANKVEIAERKRRSILLHQLSETKKNHFYQLNKGTQRNVLFESEQINGFLFGFTENYIRVKTIYKPSLINQIVSVRLNEIDQNGIYVLMC